MSKVNLKYEIQGKSLGHDILRDVKEKRNKGTNEKNNKMKDRKEKGKSINKRKTIYRERERWKRKWEGINVKNKGKKWKELK